jgi:hypothetical protein
MVDFTLLFFLKKNTGEQRFIVLERKKEGPHIPFIWGPDMRVRDPN